MSSSSRSASRMLSETSSPPRRALRERTSKTTSSNASSSRGSSPRRSNARTRAEAGDAIVYRITRGQHQNRQRQPLVAQSATDGEAIHARKPKIKYEQIRRGSLDRSQRASAVRYAGHVIAFRGERSLEHPPDRAVVFDDENCSLHE